MNKPILSIPIPCSEDWETMSAESQGRFCGSCSKIVVDFTQMNNLEIIKYLEQNKNACGRASKDQLLGKRIYVIPLKKKRRYWPSIAAMLVVGVFSITPVFSQIDQTTKTDSIYSQTTTFKKVYIKGIVLDEATNEPLPYIMVTIKKGTRGVLTDENGKFQIEMMAEEFEKGGTLEFKSVGYNTDSIPMKEFKNTQVVVKLKESEMYITVGIIVEPKIINVVDGISIPVNSPLNEYMLEYQKNEYFQESRYSPY